MTARPSLLRQGNILSWT